MPTTELWTSKRFKQIVTALGYGVIPMITFDSTNRFAEHMTAITKVYVEWKVTGTDSTCSTWTILPVQYLVPLLEQCEHYLGLDWLLTHSSSLIRAIASGRVTTGVTDDS